MKKPFTRPIALALALLMAAAAWLSIPAASADTTLYTKAKIKLFQAKNTDSKVLCRIPKGTALSIQEKGKNWCQVTYEDQTGYVRTAKLSAKKPGGATPVPEAPQEPAVTPVPEDTPAPESTASPEDTPEPEEGDPPKSSAAPEATATAEPTLVPSPQPLPSSSPVPTNTPGPTPTPTPAPTPTPGPQSTGDPAQVGQIEELDGEILDDLEDTEDQSGMQKLDKTTNKAKDWSGQIVLGEGGLPIPQLYQHDYKKVVCVYNGIKRSVSTSGCGATCLSMLIAYETGYTYQSPYTVFRDACQQGLYKGSGLSRSAMSQLAEQYALIGQWMDLNAQELLQTLEEGKPVIAHMGPGLFTQGGHYILLRGLTEEGGVLVNDPASPERSAMAYPVEVFIQESKSGAAFFVCEGADEEKVQALPTPDPELESQDDAHGLQEEAAQPQAQPTPAAA